MKTLVDEAIQADWERWAREVCKEFKVPFDDHKVGLRLALTHWMVDRLKATADITKERDGLRDTLQTMGAQLAYLTNERDVAMRVAVSERGLNDMANKRYALVHEENAKLETEIRRLEILAVEKHSENERLRELLWLRHSCNPAGLYGDDGEQQCGQCGIDFKRNTPDEMLNLWRRKASLNPPVEGEKFE